ncbi:MAG: 50S ribosomal protein L23 [Candidatus Omnitrophica bacterium]|jgi:large subunit ribosomal protein L23|nr:50S ribosomal protein L23 [Candidatus Omnitrophota bacterium]
MIQKYKILKSLLHSEKGSQMVAFNKYVFEVDKGANKTEIKKAIEQAYKVKVKDVNTMIMSGKWRRVRFKPGKTPDWKKAVVTLRAGDKIDVTT